MRGKPLIGWMILYVERSKIFRKREVLVICTYEYLQLITKGSIWRVKNQLKVFYWQQFSESHSIFSHIQYLVISSKSAVGDIVH